MSGPALPMLATAAGFRRERFPLAWIPRGVSAPLRASKDDAARPREYPRRWASSL
ncbi:hypothetical protein C8R44DRAFT_794713 [Mycena epipterygia]|nr:hypothetical protein C8R44DRAFT_794713 [Mycena epipterygia]